MAVSICSEPALNPCFGDFPHCLRDPCGLHLLGTGPESLAVTTLGTRPRTRRLLVGLPPSGEQDKEANALIEALGIRQRSVPSERSKSLPNPRPVPDGHTLPNPLHRLYSFAGRWNRPHPDVEEEVEIFSIQDHLRPVDRLEPTPDGKLIFLDENSGNWKCATLPEGDDPPVWVAEVLNRQRQGEWGLVTESLSRLPRDILLERTSVRLEIHPDGQGTGTIVRVVEG